MWDFLESVKHFCIFFFTWGDLIICIQDFYFWVRTYFYPLWWSSSNCFKYFVLFSQPYSSLWLDGWPSWGDLFLLSICLSSGWADSTFFVRFEDFFSSLFLRNHFVEYSWYSGIYLNTWNLLLPWLVAKYDGIWWEFWYMWLDTFPLSVLRIPFLSCLLSSLITTHWWCSFIVMTTRSSSASDDCCSHLCQGCENSHSLLKRVFSML